jgi:hypothetical protein
MLEFLDTSFQIITQTKALAFLFGGAIIFSLFLFISARVPFWIRFVGIPIVLSLTIWGYSQLDNMLGYPYWGLPAQQTILLGYDVQRREGQLEIVIWVREENTSRLYLIPWSPEKEKQLKEAAERMKEGKIVGIQKLEPGEESVQKEGEKGSISTGSNWRDGDFVLHDFEEFLYPDK